MHMNQGRIYTREEHIQLSAECDGQLKFTIN